MTTMSKPAEQQSGRRNWRLAVLLAVVAVGFYAGFFIAVSNR
jgi:multidrug resistance efflux pump